MKNSFLTLLLLASTVASLSAQTPAKPDADLKLIFVPNKMLAENKLAGKLKEGIIYCTNALDKSDQGVTAASFENKPILAVKGCGEPTTPKPQTRASATRIFNIPAGKTKAKISLEVRRYYNEWTDTAPNIHSNHLSYSFLKPWQEIPKHNQLPFAGNTDQSWRVSTGNAEIPPGAEQIAVTIQADCANNFDIASITVSFE